MPFVSEEAAKLLMAGALGGRCRSLGAVSHLVFIPKHFLLAALGDKMLVCKGCFCDVMDPALPGWGSPVCGTSSMWLISNTVVEASGEKQLCTAEFVLLKATEPDRTFMRILGEVLSEFGVNTREGFSSCGLPV